LAKFAFLVAPLALPFLHLHPDPHLQGLGLVLLLNLELLQTYFTLLVMRLPMLLHFFLLKPVGFCLDLMCLHIVLLLAEFLLYPPQLQQLRALVEFPLCIELVLGFSLHQEGLTSCF
jgi:hypothetical protein